MLFRIFFSALAIVLASFSTGHAVTVTVTYSGGASGIRFDSVTNSVVGFNVSATETYVFDTVLSPVISTPTGYELHGWISSTMHLNGIGTFSAGPNYLASENGVINMYPLADPFSRMYVVFGQGTFQFGSCPSSFGACGRFFAGSTAVDGLEVAPVPSPAVGAGIPGIVIALAGFIGWRRRRRTIAAVDQAVAT